MNGFREWLDDRTSYRELCAKLLYEPIPGGQRWRYVWGSTLIFTFSLQLITGFFLWTVYSPSTQTAWESLYFIQYEMQLGWFVRGLHHYTAQAMILLLAAHLVQVVWAGAYRAPRELNWWLGVILLLLVLGLSLTGYLLPWDEKGYWATQTSTKIMGLSPLIGSALQKLLVGGVTYGHQTLTRFFALHAGLLPALLILVLVAHVAMFRRQGVTHPPKAEGKALFWPNQALLDITASAIVLAIVVFLVVWKGFDEGFVWGPQGGANLQAPADPSEPYSAARPEWYFLFLFQFLKYFPGNLEVVGAIIIPSLVLAVLVLFPLIAKLPGGHQFCQSATLVLLGSISLLTLAAMWSDRNDPVYQKAVAGAEAKAQRAVELASGMGIPKEGSLALLRADPLSQGPALFRTHCSICHRWNGHDGTGLPVMELQTVLTEFKSLDDELKPAVPRASDLAGFGTQNWMREFLKNPSDNRFFGHTELRDGLMTHWSRRNIPLMTEEEIDAVTALLASQAQREDQPALSPELVTRGVEVFAFGSWNGAQPCSNCHKLAHPDIPASGGRVAAPELTGYGSETWLRGIILNPNQPRYYGTNNKQMPKFSERLTSEEINLLVRWMRRDWFRPDGTEPDDRATD